jgi:hypothetical protein
MDLGGLANLFSNPFLPDQFCVNAAKAAVDVFIPQHILMR